MGVDVKTGPLVIERLGLDSGAQDFNSLAAIQSELAIAFQLLAAGVRESDTGFLISAYQAEDFQGFIRHGGLLLGARQVNCSQLIGYLLGNSGEIFLTNHPTTEILWDSEHCQSKYGRMYSSGDFTYLDQIGVARAFHGTGIAQELHRHFLSLVGRPILAAVVQEPIWNARSTSFFKKLGYRQIGTFYTAELKGLREVRSAVLALTEDEPSR